MSAGQRIRQGRQQIDSVQMTLDKQFHHAGSPTEIAIDLKGRMRIKEVGIDPALDLTLRMLGRAEQVVDEFNP